MSAPDGLLDAFWQYETALMANDLEALDRLFATTFFTTGAGRLFTDGLYQRGAPEPGPVDAELARLFARIGA